MSVLSDIIAQHIERELDQSGGVLELCRNELADSFGCTPSQITYVLRTRFSAVRGYMSESKRGGGGYVRIWRIDVRQQAGSVADAVREALARPMSGRQAKELIQGLVHMGMIEESWGQLMLAAVSDEALRDVAAERTAAVRSRILLQMLLSLQREEASGEQSVQKKIAEGR